jgi:hypothetical protein
VTFRVRAEVGSKVFLAGCFNNWILPQSRWKTRRVRANSPAP